MTKDPYAPPTWYEPATLVRRLSGIYAIPIDDGLGPLKGEEVIDGKPHYVRHMPNQPDLQLRAAAMIQGLEEGKTIGVDAINAMVEELKLPADPLNIGQMCIVPIHREAIARLRDFLNTDTC